MKATRERIAQILAAEGYCPVSKLRLPDREYTLPTVTAVRDKMENFAVRPYKAEVADCDNRALMLTAHFSGLGYAFGWASIGPHDICVFVSEEGKLWYVEPGNCTIYPPDNPLTWLVIP